MAVVVVEGVNEKPRGPCEHLQLQTLRPSRRALGLGYTERLASTEPDKTAGVRAFNNPTETRIRQAEGHKDHTVKSVRPN